MNDPWDKLERQLEQATAPEWATAGSLDAETASLREGWLALDELLQAAEPPAAEPVNLPGPAPPVRRTARKAAGIAALAATLLVGLTLAGKWMRSDRPGGWEARVQPSLPEIARAEPEPFGADAEPASPDADPVPADVEPLETSSLADWSEWDDPLDQQIASVAREVVRVQQDWDRMDGAFGLLYVGMEEMSDELEQSPL